MDTDELLSELTDSLKPHGELRHLCMEAAATISRLTADIETLESNARVQAKLLADTGRERDGLRKALEGAQSVLAMFIDPTAIVQTTTVNAYAQAVEAEAKARVALTTNKSNESGSTTNDVP